MLVGIDFGLKEIKLENTKLIIAAVLMQLVAIIGAVGMSRLSKRFGNIQVLLITLAPVDSVCITAYFITTEIEFFVLASLIGLVMGGIQSLQSFYLFQTNA